MDKTARTSQNVLAFLSALPISSTFLTMPTSAEQALKTFRNLGGTLRTGEALSVSENSSGLAA